MQRILPPKKEHIRPWSSLPGSGKVHDFGGVRVHGDRTGHGGGGSVLTVVRVATALPTVKQTTNHCINCQNNAIKKSLFNHKLIQYNCGIILVPGGSMFLDIMGYPNQ